MSNFITKEDYYAQIRETKLDQILQGNDALLDLAEGTAVQNVRDALVARYDVDVIFATTGADRPANVVRWCTTLALYYLWERVPDRLLPKRVGHNYEITIGALQEISDGKSSVELPPLIKDDGTPKTKFRWGGDYPRSW